MKSRKQRIRRISLALLLCVLIAGSVRLPQAAAAGPDALAAANNQIWQQGSNLQGGAESYQNPNNEYYSQGDALGSAVATGDFNGDGFCDLAVGSPDAGPNAGSVAIIYGAGSGLVNTNNQFIGPFITPAHFDNFGTALTAGYFNADDIMDLAVGVPAKEENSSVLKGGAVHIYHGQSTGFITTVPDQFWNQSAAGILGAAEKEDCMGAALAAADFDNNGFTDLAIGSPGEDEDAGAVRVLYGTGNHTPFANPGGPYNATKCDSITLNGSASSDKNQPADTLTYEWDLDGDGVFGETGPNAARGNELGAHPVFLTTNPGAATYFPINLKVTDNGALSSTNMGAVLLNNEFPVFTPPANISVPATPTLCKSMVNIVAPTPATSCIAVTITGVRNDGLPLWEYYPTGDTTIAWTATDAVGLSTVHHQTIRVYDNTPPVFSYVPADITAATTPNQATAAVTPGFPLASDSCSLGVTITGERSDGQSLYSPYPIGVTGITWKAKDAADNTAYDVQKITVTDNEPPALVCPANLDVPSDAGTTYAHLSPGSPTATDNASNVTLTARRSDDMTLTAPYPAGATSITWHAVDAYGNQTTCVQSVRVRTQADLSVAIASSASLVQVGQEFSFVLTVANTGPSPALGVTASATLPAGMAFLSANPSSGSCSYDPAQRKVECTMGVLSQNSSRPVEVIVRGIEPLTGSILAAAAANTATTSDVQPANNTAAVTVTVRQ